ncbi:hypothetical protein FWF93_00450 [Candidatus Saccharibacteria bacterium]|jgi:hypothetical protein|nr:hypothetical protein [Candidatus Saccharibacteria bacterium]
MRLRRAIPYIILLIIIIVMLMIIFIPRHRPGVVIPEINESGNVITNGEAEGSGNSEPQQVNTGSSDGDAAVDHYNSSTTTSTESYAGASYQATQPTPSVITDTSKP